MRLRLPLGLLILGALTWSELACHGDAQSSEPTAAPSRVDAPRDDQARPVAPPLPHPDPLPVSAPCERTPADPPPPMGELQQVPSIVQRWTAPMLAVGDAPQCRTDRYALLTVEGDYTVEYEFAGSLCGSPSPPRVDRAARSIEFLNESFDALSVDRIVVSILADDSACGLTDTEVFTAAVDESRTFDLQIGPLGKVGAFFGADGRITIRSAEIDRTLVLGQSVTLLLSGADAEGNPVTGTVRFLNEGYWPRSGLELWISSD